MGKQINYKAFIYGGVAIMGLGSVFMTLVSLPMGMAILAAGLGWFAIGLANRQPGQ